MIYRQPAADILPTSFERPRGKLYAERAAETVQQCSCFQRRCASFPCTSSVKWLHDLASQSAVGILLDMVLYACELAVVWPCLGEVMNYIDTAERATPRHWGCAQADLSGVWMAS